MPKTWPLGVELAVLFRVQQSDFEPLPADF